MTNSRIGLALSGGGFRATLFHLGVLRCLKKAELLSRVNRITSVSGGSVLAAHMVLYWDKYIGNEDDFDQASESIVSFTMSDVRGRALRKWLMSWITVLPRFFSRWRLTNLLQLQYDKLLGSASLGDLPIKPDLQILCTSMTTGNQCSFDRRGISFHRDKGKQEISTTTLKLAFAVAASSAFPPLFPPVRVDQDVLLCGHDELPIPEVLTDGGIFDNLGIERLLSSQIDTQDLDFIIISDAEGNFDWSPDEPYASFLGRNVRASDMLMRRVSLLQSGFLWKGRKDIHRVHIGSIVSSDDDPVVPDPGTQRALRTIRTDLDAFSSREVNSLVAHGYSVTRKVLSDSGMNNNVPPYSWPALTEKIGESIKQWSKKDEEASRSRRFRLLAFRDLASWISIATFLGYIGLAGFFFIIKPNFQIRNLREQNQKLATYSSEYIRDNHNKSVIVFVHGVFGDSVNSWVCSRTRVPWPQLLASDPTLDKFDIFTVGYPSNRGGSGMNFLGVSELIEMTLESSRVLADHEHVIFVTHDVGGLLVQSLLVTHRSEIPKVSAIVNYGVPFNGSTFARLATVLSPDATLRAMTNNEEIDALRSDWLSFGHDIKMYCAYETMPVKGITVVDQSSATALCNQNSMAIDANHIDLVKPCDRNDVAYQYLKLAIQESTPTTSKQAN